MPELNPSEALNLALNTITTQIRNVASLPAERCQQALIGLEPLITANLATVMDACNASVDEYNARCDELEAIDLELCAAQSTIRELQAAKATEQQRIDSQLAERDALAAERDEQLFQLQRECNRHESKANAAQIALRGVESQLKALKELNPEGLKARLKEKTDLLEAQRQHIAKLKDDAANYRRDILRLEARIKELINAVGELDRVRANQEEVIIEIERGKAARIQWLSHLRKTYKSEDGTLWNAYVVDHGLNANVDYLINDLDWKIHVMKSDGSGLSVMLSQWGLPIYPKPYGEGVPEALTEDLVAFLTDALAESHPHILPRAEWAKGISVHDIPGIPPRAVKALVDAKMNTLYLIMSHQGGKLDEVKGLGDKLLGQTLYACNKLIAEWEQRYHQEQEAA